jgi:hypothetical protein
MRTGKFASQSVDYDEREPSRHAALATLRWILGGHAVDQNDFMRGFGALPPNLRPLAADFGLRHLGGLDARRRAMPPWVGWRAKPLFVTSARL